MLPHPLHENSSRHILNSPVRRSSTTIIYRTINFKDFQNVLDWVKDAGPICEEEGHHAEFSLGWGRADAKIYTHKVNGLAQADLVLAAKFVGITPPQL